SGLFRLVCKVLDVRGRARSRSDLLRLITCILHACRSYRDEQSPPRRSPSWRCDRSGEVTGSARFVDTLLRVVASLLGASLVIAAWHDVSKAWDVWSYHLPYAGRIVGLVDPSSYA